MATKTQTESIVTCDICGGEPVVRSASVTVGYALIEPVKVSMQFSSVVPYVPSNDVCRECVHKAIRRYCQAHSISLDAAVQPSDAEGKL